MGKRQNEKQIVAAWWGSVGWAAGQVKEGKSLRSLAKALNEDGSKTMKGRAWTDVQLKRDIAKYQDMQPLPRDPNQERLRISMPTFEPWEEPVNDEEIKLAIKKAEDYKAEHPEVQAKDWRERTSDSFAWKTKTDPGFGILGLSSKDRWSRDILPGIVEQTMVAGKPVLDLLAEVEEHPAAKGQLTRLWFGVMRVIGQQQETIMKLEEDLKAARGGEERLRIEQNDTGGSNLELFAREEVWSYKIHPDVAKRWRDGGL